MLLYSLACLKVKQYEKIDVSKQHEERQVNMNNEVNSYASVRTDLALERIEINKQALDSVGGVTKEEERKSGVLIVRVEIESDEAVQMLQKPKGTYLTIHVSDFKVPAESFMSEVETVAAEISQLLPCNAVSALVVGLGNSQITPDSLGPKSVSYLFATRHIDDSLKKAIGLEGIRSVSAIAPGVLGQTGIETAEVVSSLVKELSPDVVIVIDALAAKSINRLGTTIQISNTGISPGSGVQNKRKELSKATLGVPVISIGVPMVVDMMTIANDIAKANNSSESSEVLNSEAGTMMVTPREIDVVTEHAAKMVAYAVNKALQPSLTLDTLVSLVG